MIVGIIYKLFLLLTLAKSFFVGRKNGFRSQKFIFVYLLITFLNECIAFTRDFLNPEVKTGLQYNIYFLFCIIYFTFYFTAGFRKTIKLVSLISAILSLGFVVFITDFTGQDFDKRIGITITLFYIINSLLWYFQKITFFDEYKITDDPAFWIFTALLMWSCFFIFRITPMFYFAKNDLKFLQFLKTGQNIINILMYAMFFISLNKFETKVK